MTAPMPIATLALRSWIRYLVPLTCVALVAYAAIAIAAQIASGLVHIADAFSLAGLFADPPAKPPIDLAAVHAQLRIAWVLAGGAVIVQIALAGAAVPAVRAIATGAPMSQARAAIAGLAGLARAIVPSLVAVLAVALGGVALVVPGIALLVLFALTGASAEAGATLPQPLVDSAAVARAQLATIAIVVAAVIALDFGIAIVARLAIVHALPAKPTAQTLALAKAYVRVVALALAAASALPACALAAVYQKR